MGKRKIRACKNCGWRQYYRKTTKDWRCDRCGFVSNGIQIEEKEKKEYPIVRADKLPDRPKSKWAEIVKDFMDSGEKVVYIQFDDPKKLNRARSGLGNYANRNYNIKVTQFGDLMRIYMERTDLT